MTGDSSGKEPGIGEQEGAGERGRGGAEADLGDGGGGGIRALSAGGARVLADRELDVGGVDPVVSHRRGDEVGEAVLRERGGGDGGGCVCWG